MEKLNINIFRSFVIAVVISLIIYLILYINGISIEDLKIFFAAIVVGAIITFLLNFVKKKEGLYFSNEGIILIVNGKKHLTNWENINIKSNIKLKYLFHIVLKMESSPINSYTIAIYWPTEIDVIEKTKKYCPKNHEFYFLVKEYSEKRNLPF